MEFKNKMSQTQQLYELLSSGSPYRTDEIVRTIYGEGMSLARVGARIYDIKHKYGVEIKSWKDKDNSKLWWYQMTPKEMKTMNVIRNGKVVEQVTI